MQPPSAATDDASVHIADHQLPTLGVEVKQSKNVLR